MRTSKHRLLGFGLAVVAGAALYAVVATAAPPVGLTNVPSANQKAVGFDYPNVLSPQFDEVIAAQGSTKLENPSALTSYYGYDNDGPMAPPLGSNAEATKTEPDKNTYLVLKDQAGADPSYDYGTHFLFQGHENGVGGGPIRSPGTTAQKKGYITRINLDADAAHRVTLMATTEAATGDALPVFDGSTWDPFASRLLFTAENGNSGGVWQATLGVPSQVVDISGVFGRAGYEGVQNDSEGNVYVIEDTGGSKGSAGASLTHARQPNSFVFRFVPKDAADLTEGGKLQVLQVMSLRHAGPIVFGGTTQAQIDADIKSADTKDLHTYGHVFQTNWKTIHDTAVDGFTPFDANALAKAAGGTPFKRPENGQFQPGSKFKTFYFDETGDTDMSTEAGADYGGFGGIQKLTQDPKSDAGTLTLFYQGDVSHTGLDNNAFLTKDAVVFVEDAGDTLHTQRDALDSAFVFDLSTDYSNPANQPLRILAEGRDASATIDSGLSGSAGFQNDGDNEITGFHVSDGDPTKNGLLGAKDPNPWKSGWRVFYTQQHGDNVTWEIVPKS